MYCIKCGVKLAASEKECPLCRTRVFHPDLDIPQGDPLYPRGKYPAAKPRSLLAQVIISFLFLLPLLIVPLCDLQLNGQIVWSGYVVGALLLSYVVIVLPTWFRRSHAEVFVPCTFAAIALYLLYIDLTVKGGWFLSFALPITGGVGLIVTAVAVLLKYVKKGAYFIIGGAFIAFGGLMLMMEFLLSITFGLPWFIGWSLYPLIALCVLGGLLIYIGGNRAAREMLARKLFI